MSGLFLLPIARDLDLAEYSYALRIIRQELRSFSLGSIINWSRYIQLPKSHYFSQSKW